MIKKTGQILCIVMCLFALHKTVLGTETYQSDHTPWSGWWWPYSEGGLATGENYHGRPAPLEKYQMLIDGRRSGEAIAWYKERYHNPNAPRWHGLCGFWARAACYENIEFYPSSENNIVFRVGDKKGLVTLSHNNDLIYDIRENGSSPEVFHRWLLTYIKGLRVPFMFDRDPGEEGWSHALYRYEMDTTVIPGGESVTVTIYYADDNVKPDFVGTQTLTKTYTYDLVVDGLGNITGGVWTGDSLVDHPEWLTFPQMVDNKCPGLDYDEVLRIAQARDDYLENGKPYVEISPGTYNLVLLDEDTYRIDCEPGDIIQLKIEKQIGSEHSILSEIKDSQGVPVHESSINLKSPLNTIITAVSPPYYITLTQSDYTDPNIYTVVLDQQRHFNQDVLYIPKNGYWSGFALTNYDENPVENVTVAAYKKSGDPLQTIFGPVTFSAGEKQIFLFENLPWRLHEYNELDHIVLTAENHIGHINMIGSSVIEAAASQVQGASMGRQLILPETSSTMSVNKVVTGSLTNPNFSDVLADLKVFQASGQLVKSTTVILDPREKIDLQAGKYPFSQMPGDGWIQVTTEGDAEIGGYQYIEGSGSNEGIFGIPVTTGIKYIAHVPPANGNWDCSAVLINPNDDYNTVRFHPIKAGDDGFDDLEVTLSPFEKRTIQEFQPMFGKNLGDPLYRSTIELSGSLPFAGYYMYKPASTTDEAYFPFFNADELNHELVLHHNAGKGSYWWTAACIFNQKTLPIEVWVKPYDEAGNLWPDKVSKIQIPAGGYEIILLRQYFGVETSSKISFVKFTEANGEGDLGGFVLYGTMAYGMITGYNM